MTKEYFDKLYHTDLRKLEVEVAKDISNSDWSIRSIISWCKKIAREDGYTAFARQDVVTRIITTIMGICAPELNEDTRLKY